MITVEQLQQILPNNTSIHTLCASLNKILPKYDINTKNRISGFLAQCAVESAEFTKLTENLNYSSQSLMKVWPSKFTSAIFADRYARSPEKIANYVYANRYGNGNESSGDGWKYRGRGAIQTTFQANYKAFADYKQLPIDTVVAYCETLDGALESACFYWKKNNINQECDKDNIQSMTRKINAASLDLPQRTMYYEKAKSIL
jgi:putative chitinase